MGVVCPIVKKTAISSCYVSVKITPTHCFNAQSGVQIYVRQNYYPEYPFWDTCS